MRNLVYKKDETRQTIRIMGISDFGIIGTFCFVHQCGAPGSVLPDHYPIEREGS